MSARSSPFAVRGAVLQGRPGTAELRASRGRLIPFLVTLPTLSLALLASIGWGFNGLYGQDPFAYLDYAVGPLRHSLLAGGPLPAFFWPLGYPSFVALLSLPFGQGPLAGQAASLLAGVGAVALTYLFGRDVFILAGVERPCAARAAAIGAVAFGVCGWTIEASIMTLADTTALAAALMSALAILRWRLDSDGGPEVGTFRARLKAHSPALTARQRAWLALAGAALGWSIVTRWGQLAFVVVWAVALLPVLLEAPRTLVRAAPWALAPFVVILGAQLALTFSVPPAPYLGRWPFAGDLSLLSGGGGWSLAHLFQQTFANADGIRHYATTNLVFYAREPFSSRYLTPAFVLPVLFGSWLVATRYRGALVWLVLWPLTLLMLDAGLAEQNPRFVLAVMPSIALLAGLGTASALDRARPAWRAAGLVLLAAALVAVGAFGSRQTRALVTASRSDRDVAAWAAARLPRGATLVTFEITLTVAEYTRLRPIDLSELSPADLRRVAREPAAYLLVRPTTMRGQMAERAPGVNFRQLWSSPGLRPIGGRSTYTLYRIGGA